MRCHTGIPNPDYVDYKLFPLSRKGNNTPVPIKLIAQTISPHRGLVLKDLQINAYNSFSAPIADSIAVTRRDDQKKSFFRFSRPYPKKVGGSGGESDPPFLLPVGGGNSGEVTSFWALGDQLRCYCPPDIQQLRSGNPPHQG